ncbi:copper homeostasis protein CutC [Sphingobium sp. BYY-5]|uniref:copper homeostasis protein CutC n=1 Tax=Sphingobium sp. BYY-5 TaxID=2926400 RepID=UPI001FA6EF4F|nr:copper homeostasis protein CutC [Sphingobium sp. BYY-5]MCI4592640.1 copper homeostasis protein CutC [Sphingobium sp. BYY-5]
MSRIVLEICVESLNDLECAIAGGADRVELCGALALGGLTPSAGLARLAMDRVRAGGRTLRAMVRPRDGDFAYDEATLATAVAEGAALIDLGVDGLVFGAARNGRLETDVLRLWVGAMRERRPDIGLTLHRAIDLVDDPVAAVDLAVDLGFDRILSSGGAVKASDALPVLAAMQARAAGRIIIMPGSGIRAGNVRAVIAAVGAREVHASASAEAGAADRRALDMGFALGVMRRTSLAEVKALREALDA